MATEKWITPRQIARQRGISPEKVLGWIRRGELRAYDLSSRPGGRPRWHIRPADLERFDQGRLAQPVDPAPRRRRRPNPDIVEIV